MTDSEKAQEWVKKTQAKHAKEIAEAGAMTEAQMREATVPTLDTPEELSAYIAGLVDRPHDYGTCAYAMSMAAIATFNYMARKLGVTGFQASCADLDILKRTRGWKWGRLLNYENLLYPQYCNSDNFPSAEVLLVKEREKLSEMAKEKLKEAGESAHPNVLAHWKMLAAVEQERDEARAQLERIRTETGEVVHTRDEDCIGCGCMSLSAEEAVAEVICKRDALESDVYELRHQKHLLKQAIAELVAGLEEARGWVPFSDVDTRLAALIAKYKPQTADEGGSGH